MMVEKIKQEVEIASVPMGSVIVFDDIDVNVNSRVPRWP